MKKECEFSLGAVILSALILGAAASLSHFAYPLSGDSALVGLFNPVNESVWEHLKFMHALFTYNRAARNRYIMKPILRDAPQYLHGAESVQRFKF